MAKNPAPPKKAAETARLAASIPIVVAFQFIFYLPNADP
jgi:hypothetical protein